MKPDSCPLCEKEFVPKDIFSFQDYSLYTCSNCYVRFTQPFIDNKDVYTDDFIIQHKEYFNMNNFSIYPLLREFVHVKNKRILDIGCGTGNFLDNLKAENEVFGIETNKAFKTFLDMKRIPHRIGDLETQLNSLPNSYFDLITFWDVFEHLQNPARILELVRNKLSRDGLIINWTNNYDDYISMFSELIYRISFGLIKSFMGQSFNRIGGHNYNFIAKSLEMLYQRAGLKIIRTIITDTASKRLTKNLIFRITLEFFYLANSIFGKGKIICHVLEKNN